jgi:hypothetical protein
MMRCKQCGEGFSKTESYDVWELKRQYVQPDPSALTAHVHVEDAGLFCSRTCLKDYLRHGDRSGVFDMRKPTD